MTLRNVLYKLLLLTAVVLGRNSVAAGQTATATTAPSSAAAWADTVEAASKQLDSCLVEWVYLSPYLDTKTNKSVGHKVILATQRRVLSSQWERLDWTTTVIDNDTALPSLLERKTWAFDGDHTIVIDWKADGGASTNGVIFPGRMRDGQISPLFRTPDDLLWKLSPRDALETDLRTHNTAVHWVIRQDVTEDRSGKNAVQLGYTYDYPNGHKLTEEYWLSKQMGCIPLRLIFQVSSPKGTTGEDRWMSEFSPVEDTALWYPRKIEIDSVTEVGDAPFREIMLISRIQRMQYQKGDFIPDLPPGTVVDDAASETRFKIPSRLPSTTQSSGPGTSEAQLQRFIDEAKSQLKGGD